MDYTVRFTATARRDLHKLPPRVLSAVIEFALGDLEREPCRVGKPLRRELAGRYRAPRALPVLYHIDDDRSLLLTLRKHRADVYPAGTAQSQARRTVTVTKRGCWRVQVHGRPPPR